MGVAASLDVLLGCLVHDLGKVVIVLGVHWEMGNLPFKVLLEGRPVRFPKVESPLERDRGRDDAALTVTPMGWCWVFGSGSSTSFLLKPVKFWLTNNMVITCFSMSAIEGLWLFGIMDEIKLVAFSPCFNSIPICVVISISPLRAVAVEVSDHILWFPR